MYSNFISARTKSNSSTLLSIKEFKPDNSMSSIRNDSIPLETLLKKGETDKKRASSNSDIETAQNLFIADNLGQ